MTTRMTANIMMSRRDRGEEGGGREAVLEVVGTARRSHQEDVLEAEHEAADADVDVAVVDAAWTIWTWRRLMSAHCGEDALRPGHEAEVEAVDEVVPEAVAEDVAILVNARQLDAQRMTWKSLRGEIGTEHVLEPVEGDVAVVVPREQGHRRNGRDDVKGRARTADSALRRRRSRESLRRCGPANAEQEIGSRERKWPETRGSRPPLADEDEERSSRSEESNDETPTRGSSLRTIPIRRRPAPSPSGRGRWTR